MSSRATTARDKKHGGWREKTEPACRRSSSTGSHGKLDGAVKKYVDGKVASDATYKDGKAEGAYTEYRDGKPSLTGQFKAECAPARGPSTAPTARSC